MKLCGTIVVFFALLGVAPIVSGQETSCSCEKSGSTCRGTVTCPHGCSALCGSKDVCVFSCARGLLGVRLTIKLVNQRGQQIASALSARTNKKIRFTPYAQYARERYDLEMKNDDIWNALSFLDKYGKVSIDGTAFSTLKKLMRKNKSNVGAPK